MPLALPLAALQREFQAGLQRDKPHTRLARYPGFAIHRSTMERAAIDALEANYPAVACLVGQAWFRSAAAAYATEHPARDARLVVYGEWFPDFLAAAPVADELPYLVDVSRLDRAWTESYIATDAPALTVDAVRTLPPDALGELAIVLHPATRFVSSAFPVFSIWQASRDGHAVGDDLIWEPQATRVTRPGLSVDSVQIDSASLAFLEACSVGITLAGAVDHVLRTHPSARADLLFAQLLTAGALAAA